MNDIERMLIERACERLVNTYACRLDAYDYDGFMKIWTDDATWVMLGRPMVGTAAIAAGLVAREDHLICRHLVTNVIIDVIDNDHASGTCYTLAFRTPHARGKEPGLLERPAFAVDYSDEFVRHPQRGWLFARREARAPLVGAAHIQAMKLAAGDKAATAGADGRS